MILPSLIKRHRWESYHILQQWAIYVCNGGNKTGYYICSESCEPFYVEPQHKTLEGSKGYLQVFECTLDKCLYFSDYDASIVRYTNAHYEGNVEVYVWLHHYFCWRSHFLEVMSLRLRPVWISISTMFIKWSDSNL